MNRISKIASSFERVKFKAYQNELNELNKVFKHIDSVGKIIDHYINKGMNPVDAHLKVFEYIDNSIKLD